MARRILPVGSLDRVPVSSAAPAIESSGEDVFGTEAGRLTSANYSDTGDLILRIRLLRPIENPESLRQVEANSAAIAATVAAVKSLEGHVVAVGPLDGMPAQPKALSANVLLSINKYELYRSGQSRGFQSAQPGRIEFSDEFLDSIRHGGNLANISASAFREPAWPPDSLGQPVGTWSIYGRNDHLQMTASVLDRGVPDQPRRPLVSEPARPPQNVLPTEVPRDSAGFVTPDFLIGVFRMMAPRAARAFLDEFRHSIRNDDYSFFAGSPSATEIDEYRRRRWSPGPSPRAPTERTLTGSGTQPPTGIFRPAPPSYRISAEDVRTRRGTMGRPAFHRWLLLNRADINPADLSENERHELLL
jgi:hypothetical protein